MLDACGVEHVIMTMQHGYVQCSRPGYAGLRNYRRRELQLLLGASDDEEGQSSTDPKKGSNEPPQVRVRAMWLEKNRSLPWP